MKYKALTIAGSDSGGGAGIQADLKTFAAYDVYGSSVITSITAQNTIGVQGVFDISPDFIARQIDSVLSDIGAHAIKTGMLSTAEIIVTVADRLQNYRDIPLIIDPVMVAKSGDSLLAPEAVSILIERLLPLATVVTPNLNEAKTLTGLDIIDLEGMKKAAHIIHEMGADAVVVKGGHLDGAPTDVFYDGRDYTCFEADRIETVNTHGTGCTFASAIAAEIAKGVDVKQAVASAKVYLTDAIRYAEPVGNGHGPVHHLHALHRDAEQHRVLTALSGAVRRLEDAEAGTLVPEVQSNLAMGLPGAQTPKDVAAFPGRLVRLHKCIRTLSPPEFGASSHIAKIVLTVMRHDASKRAVMNILYTEPHLNACKELGLDIASFDRRQEPKDVKEREGSSLEWGTEQTILELGRVPDIIYDLGDVGKEEMIRIIGTDPEHVTNIALKIVELTNK